MPISVACTCGVRLKTKDANAGRSLRCPKCGEKIRVPGSAPVATSAPAGKPPASDPVPDDVYGLDEAPAPAVASRTPGNVSGAGADAAAEEKLPPRAEYGPLSEAKKKKIAKRAEKIDKTKPSFAGASVGVSLATVLAIALFGWRIYRVTHRFGRAMDRMNATAEVDPSDDKVTAADVEPSIEEMIKDPNSAEAREWLDAAKHPNHYVFEMGNERARMMVAGFYERGAERVYVVDPTKEGNNVITAQFVVKLPTDPAKRKECLAFAAPYLEEDGPIPDEGQKYLLIMTD